MKKRLAILLLAGTFLGTGCGSNNDFVITGNNPQVVAPVCAADTYTTNANTTLTVPAATGVLANDTPNGATPVFDATSAQGGTITGTQDGGFTYSPLANFSGTDSFNYRLTNSGGTVTCTVTITVVAVNGFFVDAATGSDTTGSFTNGLPFATVQAAVAAAGTNQDIVVRPGSYTGTVSLKNGQRLLGSGSTLITPQGVTRPVLTGPIDMADGNTLDFLRVAGTSGNAVICSDQDGGTVTNCEFANTSNTGTGVGGTSVTGNWTVSNNTFTNLTGGGVFFSATVTDAPVIVVKGNTMTGNSLGAVGLQSEDTSNVKASVVGNTFSGNNTVTGDAFELICGDSSTFCLNLEDNTNDDDYRVGEFNTGNLSIEQFATLTTPQPGGAGNTGNVIDSSTGTIADVANGFCGF